MKDFIQNRLRVLLEAVEDVKTINRPETPSMDVDIPRLGISIPGSIRFKNDMKGFTSDEIKDMIKDAENLAEKIKNSPQIDDKVSNDMLLNHDYGSDGAGYEYSLYKRKDGNFNLVGKLTTKNFQPGDYNIYGGTSGKILYMYTKACSKDSKTPCKSIYNPMVDAKIKLLSDPVVSDAIKSFIDDELGYLDDKGAEIQASKMSPDQLTKLAGKEDLYTKRSTQEKGYFGDEKELKKQLNDLVIARRNATSMEEKKKIRNQELELKNALANIEKERRDRLSTNR
jgi:hypothetical protein